jgi:hypothetical protein
MRLIAALNHLSDTGHASRAEQLAQLGELIAVLVRYRGDEVRALARAPRHLSAVE